MRTKRPAVIVIFAATAAIAAIACGSGSSDRQCSSGADCASGACNSDGTCVVGSNGSDDSGASTTNDSGGGPTFDASYTIDASSLACAQTDDAGTLGHDNVPLAAGLDATFLVAKNETVDTAGTMNADGSRSWDFSGSLASDQKAILQTLSPSGQWWSGDYTTATYASKLQASADPLGIFDYAPDALKLIGVVSSTDTAASKTEVTYDTPIPILAFPLTNGKTWTTTANVTGTFQGLPNQFYTEKYESKVDAYGTVKTPYATFPALRVGTLLTQTYGALVTYTRTYAWVTACFGTVAKATSASATYPSSAPATDFTTAAELERLTK